MMGASEEIDLEIESIEISGPPEFIGYVHLEHPAKIHYVCPPQIRIPRSKSKRIRKKFNRRVMEFYSVAAGGRLHSVGRSKKEANDDNKT